MDNRTVFVNIYGTYLRAPTDNIIEAIEILRFLTVIQGTNSLKISRFDGWTIVVSTRYANGLKKRL